MPKVVQSVSVMGIEGGGRVESFDRRRSPEDPFGRGIKARDDYSPDETDENENYWLGQMGIIPETINGLRQYPANTDSSTEYLIYDFLYAKLVEGGAEWGAPKKARVRNLLGVMRLVGYPNMTETDQATLVESAHVANMDTLQYEITPDAVSDVRWIWRTFGLQVPQAAIGQGILEAPPAARLQARHPRRIE